jgi:hypothetical protein
MPKSGTKFDPLQTFNRKIFSSLITFYPSSYACHNFVESQEVGLGRGSKTAPNVHDDETQYSQRHFNSSSFWFSFVSIFFVVEGNDKKTFSFMILSHD